MKLFKVGVWEENSGYVWVRAKDVEEADEKANDLVCEHGVEELFNGCTNEIEGSKHTHGDRYVVDGAEEDER
tara:strand:- start:1924 stop:2139 length:216 start_codon:yes stop_codon:yes gene_type:complete